MSNPATRRRDELRPFQLELLSWDFYEDVFDDRDKTGGSSSEAYESIPERFKSSSEYINSFECLFYEETRAQIERAKTAERGETETFAFESFKVVEEKEGLVRVVFNRRSPLISKQVFSRNDFVVISANSDVLSPCQVHATAFVDDFQGTSGQLSLLVRLDLSDPPRVVINCSSEFSARSRLVAERLAGGTDWFVTKITSVSTAQREFVALRGLSGEAGGCDPALLEFILNRETLELSPDTLKFSLPHLLREKLTSIYNEWQFAAIEASCVHAGLSLIQGPPGTGKTSTILGVIAAMLARPLEGETTAVKRKGLKELLACNDDTMETSDSELADDRINDRIALMRSLRRPHWEDAYPLTLDAVRDARQVYSALGVDKEKVRKVYKEGVVVGKRGKILVCAPSNAAIDEIVRRLVKEGVFGADGDRFLPRVVRVGPNFHPNLNDNSFNKQSEQRMASASKHASMGDVSLVDAVRQAILSEADVVASTLSVAGSNDIRSFTGLFDTVIIDEASQGIELATLIPLGMGCRRLVLVGDHKQLPATVFSLTAQSLGYGRSLFQRLQSTGYPISVLRRQFRMHPLIAAFPSKEFYEGKIENAENILQLVNAASCSWYSESMLGPLVFWDVKTGSEESVSKSLKNEQEARTVEQIVRTLLRKYPEENWKDKIAVVTPYAEQVRVIRDRLRQVFGVPESKPCPVEVNTVDGFQGREKDCVIVSTVRASDEGDSIGFLRDARRMNVTLTRARQNLWVVGNATMLRKNRLWSDFIDFVEKDGLFVEASDSVLSSVKGSITHTNQTDKMDIDREAENEVDEPEPEEIE